MRRVATPDEIFDILDDVSGKRFATVGYVTGADINYPKVQRRNPETGRMKGYDDMDTFARSIGRQDSISGVIKLTRYNMRLYSRSEMGKAYGEKRSEENDIRARYGVPPIKDKENDYTQKIDYGGGITAYGGSNDDKKGHVYYDNNTFGANIKSHYYVVDGDGHIDGEVSRESLLDYLKAPAQKSGVAALRKMGATEDMIQNYINDLQGLRFSYKRFEYGQILYIAATVKGEKLLYINDRMSSNIGGLDINPSEFIDIVKDMYRDDLAQLDSESGDNSVNEGILSHVYSFEQLFEVVDRCCANGTPLLLNESDEKYIGDMMSIIRNLDEMDRRR